MVCESPLPLLPPREEFRGDTRPPQAIQACDGFKPPITRTDQHYVEKTIYPEFATYMQKRYGVEVTMGQFNAAYQEKVTNRDERLVMNGYFAWKSITASAPDGISSMSDGVYCGVGCTT